MRQEEKAPGITREETELDQALEEIIVKEKLANKKKLRAKKQQKERKKVAAEEYRQSAMERLGQTVKRHVEHFIRISFVYTRNSSSTASVCLTLEFSRRERCSLPIPFTAQLVVVVSFVVDA